MKNTILQMIDATPCQPLDDLPTADLVAFRASVDAYPSHLPLAWDTVRAYAAAGGELHLRVKDRALRDRVAELEEACERYRDRALAEQEVRHEVQGERDRLRTQVECEQREQDRLRVELSRAEHDLKVEQGLRREAEQAQKLSN